MSKNREELLNSIDAVARERVVVPFKSGLGDICLLGMTCEEYDNWDAGWDNWKLRRNGDPKVGKYSGPYLLTHVICDDGGHRLFGEDDVKRLAKVQRAIISPIVIKAMQINGMLASQEEALEKNLDGGQSEGSGSDSASLSESLT